MTRVYDNPPLVEVMADFRFVPGSPWDMTVPGLLYERVKEEFPEREQHIGINLEAQDGGLQQKIELPHRMRFSREDRTALIQVSPNRLTVNHLRPYPTWEPYRRLVEKILEDYFAIAEPETLDSVGLRYINVLEFEETPVELSDYFTYFPRIPPDLPQDHGTFNMQTQILYASGDYLMLTIKSQARDGDESGLGVVLDLDYETQREQATSVRDVATWLERAHEKIQDAFEVCITDTARERFGEVT